MKDCSILAHRGLFNCDSEKNTFTAIKRALDSGYGIETDIRDIDGRLVISHDPPLSKSSLPTLISILEIVKSVSSNPRIALNVKSDGLLGLLLSNSLIYNYIDNIYLFDMSIPDSVQYHGSPFATYGRVSEYEPLTILPHVSGFWIDNFTGNFPQVSAASSLLADGFRVCLVSSELHKLNHMQLWSEIVSSGIHLHPHFELCTDYPLEASKFFT